MICTYSGFVESVFRRLTTDTATRISGFLYTVLHKVINNGSISKTDKVRLLSGKLNTEEGAATALKQVALLFDWNGICDFTVESVRN